MSVKETVRVEPLPQPLQTLPICLRIGSFGAARIGDDVGFAHVMADRIFVQIGYRRAMPCGVGGVIFGPFLDCVAKQQCIGSHRICGVGKRRTVRAG